MSATSSTASTTKNTTKNFSRRHFLSGIAGGLVLGFVLPKSSRLAAQAPAPPRNFFGETPENKPMAYVRIGTDESVMFLVPKAEMGQGTSTACSQILAEELECDWSRVSVQHAPIDPDLYGHETTVGSMAIRTSWMPLRMAGAQAREMLIAAAAIKWGVNASQCRADNGFVINTANNARLSYGTIAADAAKLPVPKNVTLKKPEQFRIVGKPVKRLDTRDKVTGKTKFGIDTRVPGMVYAVVERCPVFGGKVAAFDGTKAKTVPGVKDVIQISTGVAVVADSTWAAIQGRKALQVQWDEGDGATTSTATISKFLADRVKEPGVQARKEGDGLAGLAKAAKTIEAAYEVPFLSHSPMEPQNTTALVHADSAEMWVPTQSPTSSRALAATALGIPPEKINFHWTLMGGGFGRRGEGELDFAPEAAELGKALMGTPVKVTWTREDDMRHDFYRPVSHVQFAGGLDAAGWPCALSIKVACPSFNPSGPRGGGVDGSGVSGLADLLYGIPDLMIDWRLARTIVPVSFLRGPGANQNTFFLESFIDELAAAGGKDPVEVRRRLLANAPRLLAVLELAAQKANWGKPLPAGHFHGVAVGNNVQSFNAQIAEVSVIKGKVKVHRVVCAFDGGQPINPFILSQQIKGGIVFGLSAALKGEITLDRGRVQQGNFNDYDVLRMDEMPEMETYIIPSTANPTGAGEATVPCIAPAVCNAIFAATGKRIRKLPIRSAELA